MSSAEHGSSNAGTGTGRGSGTRKRRSGASPPSAMLWLGHGTSSRDAGGSLSMTFGEFVKLYEEDVRPRLKLNTWLTKEHAIATKILPHFSSKRVDEITSTDIIRWENELSAARTATGEPYAPTYLHIVSNQMSAILNHVVRFYGLASNPMLKVGKMGAKQAGEMRFWTKSEHLRFSEAVMGG